MCKDQEIAGVTKLFWEGYVELFGGTFLKSYKAGLPRHVCWFVTHRNQPNTMYIYIYNYIYNAP